MKSIERSDESGTWRLAHTGMTTPIEDTSPKVITVCACPELGYWCAEYITKEMKKNLYTPEGRKLTELVQSANPISAYNDLPWWQKVFIRNNSSTVTINTLQREENALRYWKSLVGYQCIWDHKPYLKEKLIQFLKKQGFNTANEYWPWSKLGNYDYYFDIWSNIHYGFIGVHAGFMEETLTAGASLAQLIQDYKKNKTQYHPENGAIYNRFDDIPDQISIKIGIELAKEKKPINLMVSDLIIKLEQVPLPWGKGASKAKRIYECLPRL